MRENQSTIDNIRIWDHRPLSQTFRQLQQIRTYYTFGDVNVDRYWIGGDYRQVVLAARELSQDRPWARSRPISCRSRSCRTRSRSRP